MALWGILEWNGRGCEWEVVVEEERVEGMR